MWWICLSGFVCDQYKIWLNDMGGSNGKVTRENHSCRFYQHGLCKCINPVRVCRFIVYAQWQAAGILEQTLFHGAGSKSVPSNVTTSLVSTLIVLGGNIEYWGGDRSNEFNGIYFLFTYQLFYSYDMWHIAFESDFLVIKARVCVSPNDFLLTTLVSYVPKIWKTPPLFEVTFQRLAPENAENKVRMKHQLLLTGLCKSLCVYICCKVLVYQSQHLATRDRCMHDENLHFKPRNIKRFCQSHRVSHTPNWR